MRLPVWIGAIALALAGTFLVKYAFDRDLLGPAVRVALGVVFGVGLLAAGEWSHGRMPRIPAALSAAGIAVLYASFLSAGRFYQIVPPATSFALMALTTATAAALSLRQGRLVAMVGLIGGFLTPFLVGPTPDPHPAPLFGYLLLLQIGLIFVNRRRGWWEMAVLTLVAGWLWVVVWLTNPPFETGDGAWLGLFLLTSTALFVGTSWASAGERAWGERRLAQALSLAALTGGVIVMAVVTGTDGFGALEWAYLGLLGAATVVIGRLDRAYEGLPWLAAVVTGTLLLLWGLSDAQSTGAVARQLWTIAALGCVYAIGGYAAQWGAPRAARWASLGAAAGVAYFVVAYLGLQPDAKGFPWGATAIGLAAAYILAAIPVARARATALELGADQVAGADTRSADIEPAGEPVARGSASAPAERTSRYRDATESLAALAAAATVFISLAVPLETEREWITVAWSIEVAALVWLAGRLDVAALRRLAWPLVALVAVRLLLNPFVLDYPIGQLPVVNWLLYGYVLPVAAFALAAYESGQDGDRRLSLALQWLAMALGLYLLGLEVRQYFHPGELGRGGVLLVEWGALTVVWLLYGAALLWASQRWPVPSLGHGGQVVAGLALAQGLVMQGLAANPAWNHAPVGDTPVFNRLMFIYGAPAGLAAVVAWLLRRGGASRLRVRSVGAAALVLAFLLVTLEVRQAFRGTYLNTGGDAALAEQYAYSLAWVLFGLSLLAAGILRRGQFVRYASLAVMMLAVAKVFLYDMSNLRDLYRVFSFLGLGLSLLLLGYVYQRFVFREVSA